MKMKKITLVVSLMMLLMVGGCAKPSIQEDIPHPNAVIDAKSTNGNNVVYTYIDTESVAESGYKSIGKSTGIPVSDEFRNTEHVPRICCCE